MKVHVHLAYGRDETTWAKAYDDGTLIGINDRDSYGYRHAAAMVSAMTFSRDHREGPVGKLIRGGARALLGFDLIHAWRNRDAILAADVVWTHTESQHLAISQLFANSGRKPGERPKLLAQSVWLMDHWRRFPMVRRAYFRRLLRRADVLTCHSRENRAMARRLFPHARTELVLFGIAADTIHAPQHRANDGSELIVAVGNDEHRDWPTLIAAVARHPDWRLRIVSTKAAPSLADGVPNVEVRGVTSNRDLLDLYRRATVAVVPLKPNAHASGITALQEAALSGIAAVATDVGGLIDYFDRDQISYVPVGDIDAMEQAIGRLLADPDERYRQAIAAQRRMGPDGLSSQAYARRHVELSRALLGIAADG